MENIGVKVKDKEFLFTFSVPNEKNKGLSQPCASCDVEWCSIVCFERRGYMWDRARRFVKNADGKNLRKKLEDRECKVTYKNED